MNREQPFCTIASVFAEGLTRPLMTVRCDIASVRHHGLDQYPCWRKAVLRQRFTETSEIVQGMTHRMCTGQMVGGVRKRAPDQRLSFERVLSG
jgi:hypothetical protein